MLGQLRIIDNLDARFGEDPRYWFLKIQTQENEEYWLVTEEEAHRFTRDLGSEDMPQRPRGHLTRIDNADARFGAADCYYAVRVIDKLRNRATWLLTDHDLKQIRVRVAQNQEDIQANQESWLANWFG